MIPSVTRRLGLLLVVVTAGAAAAPAASPAMAPGAGAAMHPDRVLECTMRRATNADTGKLQTYEEMTFEGSHRLVLHLGPVAVRTGTPPDAATEEPESFSPLTRIDADPDGLLAGVPVLFSRVVDRWPERVEIATDVDVDRINFIALSPIDLERRTARLFMTFTTRQLGYDVGRIYIGDCTIAVKP
jgi:hypothetical protein